MAFMKVVEQHGRIFALILQTLTPTLSTAISPALASDKRVVKIMTRTWMLEQTCSTFLSRIRSLRPSLPNEELLVFDFNSNAGRLADRPDCHPATLSDLSPGGNAVADDFGDREDRGSGRPTEIIGVRYKLNAILHAQQLLINKQ